MIKYLTEWLQWSYYHAPLIPQTRYIKHVIILILLVYILAVFDIRGFLNGMSLFYLTKRQARKNSENVLLKKVLPIVDVGTKFPNRGCIIIGLLLAYIQY